MTAVTLDRPREGVADVEMVADTVARMLDTGQRITAGPPECRTGWLSLLLADARLLARLVPAVRAWVDDPAVDDRLGQQMLEEVADRLWMLTAVAR